MCKIKATIWDDCGHLVYDPESCDRYPSCDNVHVSTLHSRGFCTKGCASPARGLPEVSREELGWTTENRIAGNAYERAAALIMAKHAWRDDRFVQKTLVRLNVLLRMYHKGIRDPIAAKGGCCGCGSGDWINDRRMNILQGIILKLNARFGYKVGDAPGYKCFVKMGPKVTIEGTMEVLLTHPDHRSLDAIFREPESAAYVSLDKIPEDEIDCGICGKEYGDDCKPVQLLPCRHVFCDFCWKAWFRDYNTCPTCRHIYQKREILDHLHK